MSSPNKTTQLTQENISKALQGLKARIQKACHSVGRKENEVKVLLATKTLAPEKIHWATDQGFTLLGENKAQELVQKVKSPLLQEAQWHFIGHLQSNKVKEVLPWVSMLHSLDRLSLAKELDRRLQNLGRSLNVLVQVNTSNETSKFGLTEPQVLPFLKDLKNYPSLKVKGLMTLALNSEDPNKVRPCFQKLKALADQLKQEGLKAMSFDELSMGMSGDFEMAIEEGATIIRVGSLIFGERS